MSYKIYGGYTQWQVNNKYWRERTRDSPWRWIAFDMEHCFAGPGSDPYDGNTLVSALGLNSWLGGFVKALASRFSQVDEDLRKTRQSPAQ